MSPALCKAVGQFGVGYHTTQRVGKGLRVGRRYEHGAVAYIFGYSRNVGRYKGCA